MVDPQNKEDNITKSDIQYQQIEKEENSNSGIENVENNLDLLINSLRDDEVIIVSVANKIRKGNFKPVLKAIMEKKLPTNLVVDLYSKIYLIHYAAFFNSINVLKFLISFPETNINLLDSKSQTALQIAATSGKSESILILAENEKCDTEHIDTLNCTALLNCAKSGCVQGFLYLLIIKNSNHLIKDTNGCGILHWAAFQNSTEIILTSLSLDGISIDQVDLDGLSPLFRSIQNSSFTAFKLLLKLGANLKLKMKDGKNIKAYIKGSCKESRNYEQELNKEIYTRAIKHNSISYLFRNIKKIRNWELFLEVLFKAKLQNLFIIFLILLTLSNVYLSAELLHNSYSFLSICLIITFLTIISFIKLTKSDSIYIFPLKEAFPNNSLRNYALEGNSSKNLSKRICFFCHVDRNIEDYHCMKCNKCIIERHFHSYSIGKCIGKNNILIYNIFILCRIFLFCLFFVQYIYVSNQDNNVNIITNMMTYFITYLTSPLFIFSMGIIMCDIMLSLNDLILILSSASYKITINQLMKIEQRKDSLKFNFIKKRYELENFSMLQKLQNILDFYLKVTIGYARRKISYEMEESKDPIIQ